MMTTVVVQLPENQRKCAIVCLQIREAISDIKRVVFDNCETDVELVSNRRQAVDPEVWQSSCLSGILYALRKGKVDRFDISVAKLSGSLDESDGDAFSCAGMLAAYKALGMNWSIPGENYLGWIDKPDQ